MTDQQKHAYPYLGLAQDRESHFSYPENGHVCFASTHREVISLEHQAAFCLSQDYHACSKFTEPSVTQPREQETTSIPVLRTLLLSFAGLVVGVLIIFVVFFSSGFAAGGTAKTEVAPPVFAIATVSATATPAPTSNPAFVASPTSAPTSGSIIVSLNPSVPVTPVTGGRLYTISPNAANVGWVVSDEDRGNHFGDSYLYAGILDGRVYHSAFQFDLSAIPRGAPILYASIQLTGLRDDLLGIRNDRPNTGAAWQLNMLADDVDEKWRIADYQIIFNAPTVQTLNPILGAEDLGVGRVNQFVLSPEQIELVETKILDGFNSRISFRLDGPLVGTNTLFAWDSGYGPQSQGNSVVLLLNVGPPPATPPLYDYIVVTSTPTPENIMTAAAVAVQMTADATRVGTTTPIPPNMVTATPIPNYLVIIPTATPENQRTAEVQSAQATARALTTGTPTPIPTNAVTATPIPTPTATPTATQVRYVIITSTPTPASVFAAATLSVRLTAQARRFGTPTPLPDNWVTPVVATATPTPGNAATAQAWVQLATVVAFTTGTPTPTPANQVTATATPVFEPVSLVTPTPTSLPLGAQSIPAVLRDKILFQSDREEGDKNYVYVFDPNTGTLGRLTDTWPYELARQRDELSADSVFRTYNRVPPFSSNGLLQIYYSDGNTGQEYAVTQMGTGISYDSVWSPIDNRIAFVSTESGNDEIWVVYSDGTGLRQLTKNSWEGDKSPSWSPDGTKIVFQSNRTGNNQLWIMNADGSEQQLLMGWDNWTPFNDWGPVWVKFLDPAP